MKSLLRILPRKRKHKVDSCDPEELILGWGGLGNVLWHNHYPCSGEKGSERLMYFQVIGKHKDHYSDGDEYQFGNADTDVWEVEHPLQIYLAHKAVREKIRHSYYCKKCVISFADFS